MDIVDRYLDFQKKQRDLTIQNSTLTDVETAKIKAATIREQGQLKYNLKLL